MKQTTLYAWQTLAGVIVFAVLIFALTINNDAEFDRDEFAIKAGLEQCPKKPNSSVFTLVWVKSCKEYVDTYYKYDKR